MTHRRLIFLVGLALLLGFFNWMRVAHPTNQRSADARARTHLTSANSSPAGVSGSIRIRSVGVANRRAPNEDEQKLISGLLRASSDFQPLAGAPPRPRESKVAASLVPPSPNLTADQRVALQKLRWGLGKDLTYRGDGADATVRLLASTALAAPLDTANPWAESPEHFIHRFVSEHRALFRLDNPRDELRVTSVENDPNGGKVVRLGQRYRSLEVWPGQLTANLDRTGYLTVLTGAYAPTPHLSDVVPKLDADRAIAIALRQTGADLGVAAAQPRPELKIFADKGQATALAYDVRLSSPSEAKRVFVDAGTGEVLLVISETCSATASGADLFGVTRSISVTASGTPVRYYMQDTSKPMYSAATGAGVIAVYNAGAPPIALGSSASLTGGFDAAAVSASFNLSKVYDFYLATFSRSSFDGNGASVRAFVNARDPKTNGVMANAYWNGAQQALFFGSADAYPGASDVIGHEFTHAVVETSAHLVYNTESGALNESMADIFGEAFERYLYGSNDWLIGSFLNNKLRSLRDPGSKGQPATMSQYVRTVDDDGGVHTNSGIPNYAFYLLAEGLPSGGVGFDQALRIFYRALTTKLSSRSDFQDLRMACVQSATELYGSGSTQATRTGLAFDAIDVFDASTVGVPENLTPPSGPDAYLFAYQAVDGNTYLGRREAALGDGSSVTGISSYAVDLNSRASVSGDGSVALFVSATHDAVFARTNRTAESAAGVPGRYHAVALSSDGLHFACIARDSNTGRAMNVIITADLATQAAEAIDLYLPVADGPNSIQISTVDELDLSPDGQLALFDGFATTTLADGSKVEGWSVFALDLRTKVVFALAGPYPGVNIGNPAFARTSERRIVLEASSATGSLVIATDLTQQTVAIVRQYTPSNRFFAYPRFTAADDAVVFAEDFFSSSTLNYQPRIARIGLAADRTTGSGSASILQSFAYSGLSYRRGVFAGPPNLSVAALNASISSGELGAFRVTRVSGDRGIAVPFSFKTLGTARANVDFNQVATTGIVPAGAGFVDIPIRAAASPSAPSRALTISLDPLYHYVITGTGQATMTITPAVGPAIASQPTHQSVIAGTAAVLSVTSTDAGVTYQWQKNGATIAGATGRTLTLNNVQPASAGIYAAAVTKSATTLSNYAIVGVNSADKVIGTGSEIAADIRHPNGNTFDQILLSGSAATITSDYTRSQITRASFIDLNDDIVQVELSGPGSLTLVLDAATGPANPVKYTQNVAYMKGHAGLVVVGATENTNLSVFAVGRLTANDPTGAYNILLPVSSSNNPQNNGSPLFQGQSSTIYDGVADLAFIAVASSNGKFGGIRTSNASYIATQGVTGIYAPGVQFTGPIFVGDIDAVGTAVPMLVVGSVSDARITGGNLSQTNGRAVQVSGLTQLKFAAGVTAGGTSLPAQRNAAQLMQNGVDVTSQIVVNP